MPTNKLYHNFLQPSDVSLYNLKRNVLYFLFTIQSAKKRVECLFMLLWSSRLWLLNSCPSVISTVAITLRLVVGIYFYLSMRWPNIVAIWSFVANDFFSFNFFNDFFWFFLYFLAYLAYYSIWIQVYHLM